MRKVAWLYSQDNNKSSRIKSLSNLTEYYLWIAAAAFSYCLYNCPFLVIDGNQALVVGFGSRAM